MKVRDIFRPLDTSSYETAATEDRQPKTSGATPRRRSPGTDAALTSVLTKEGPRGPSPRGPSHVRPPPSPKLRILLP